MTMCKLCRNSRELKKSHIFPRWMVMHCRDKENGNKFALVSSQKGRKPQDGPKEDLLCLECEHKIGRYEGYYKQFFIYKHGLNILRDPENNFAITGYEYQKIRVFLLSILWRMSITTVDGFKIQADDLEQEKLRQMVYHEIPGSADEFAISAALINIDGEHDTKIFMPPTDYGHPLHLVSIYMGGIMYNISKAEKNAFFNDVALLSPHAWQVGCKHFTEVPFLMNALNNVDLK